MKSKHHIAGSVCGRSGFTVDRSRDRRGTVMIFCIVLSGLLSILILGMIRTLTVQTATTNLIESNERAAYLAEAGINHAIEVIERRPVWAGTLSWSDRGVTKPGHSNPGQYAVNVVRGASGDVDIVSTGVFRGSKQVRRVSISGAIP